MSDHQAYYCTPNDPSRAPTWASSHHLTRLHHTLTHHISPAADMNINIDTCTLEPGLLYGHSYADDQTRASQQVRSSSPPCCLQLQPWARSIRKRLFCCVCICPCTLLGLQAEGTATPPRPRSRWQQAPSTECPHQMRRQGAFTIAGNQRAHACAYGATRMRHHTAMATGACRRKHLRSTTNRWRAR